MLLNKAEFDLELSIENCCTFTQPSAPKTAWHRD